MLAGLVRSPSRLAPNRNPNGAERRAQVVIAAMTSHGFITETMAKLALAQPARAVKVAGNGSANYIADWIMDVLDDLVGHIDQDLVVRTSIDPALQAAAEAALVNELAQKGEKFGVSQGALIAMTPDRRGARPGRRQELRREPVQPRGGGAAPAGLGVQAVRLSDRAGARARAGNGARGQADRDQGLAAGELQPRILRRGHADAGPRAFAQHDFGAADPGVRADRRRPHRLSSRHRLQARGQSLARARHLRGFADRAGLGLCAVRQWRQRDRAPCGRARQHQGRQDALPSLAARSRADHRAALRRDDECDDARDRAGRHRAARANCRDGRSAGKTGTSQDFRDAWFVGYTAHLVTGVWLGNDDSSPTRRATGGGMPVDIWARFMRGAHQGVAVAALPGQSAPPTLASIVQQAVNGPPPANVAALSGRSRSVRSSRAAASTDG